MVSEKLLKIESKFHYKWNVCGILLFSLGVVLSIGGTTLFFHGIIFGYSEIKSLWGFSLGCLIFFLAGVLILSIVSFRQSFFEIYKDKFSQVKIGVRDFLKKNKVFVHYNAIKRVESEELSTYKVRTDNDHHESLKVVAVYISTGNCVLIDNSQVSTEAINKLIETLKDYFEKEKIEVEWGDTVSTLIPRLHHCRRIKVRK